MRFSVDEGSGWEINFTYTSQVQIVRLNQHFRVTSAVRGEREAFPECDSALPIQMSGR